MGRPRLSFLPEGGAGGAGVGVWSESRKELEDSRALCGQRSRCQVQGRGW